MRSGLLVTGILGVGTALVFAAAALTATLFPNGTVVRTQWNGGWSGPCLDCGGWGVPAPMPVPMPMPMPGGGFVEGDVFVNGVHADVSGDVVVAEENVIVP